MHQAENGPTSRPQAGFPAQPPSQTTTSPTKLNCSTGTMGATGSGSLASSQDDIYTARRPEIATAVPSNSTSSSQYSSRMLYVLLCVPSGWFGFPELKTSVIEIRESQDDNAFFCDFRKHYRSLRGFIPHWFDLREFSLCHTSRFEKWDVDSLGWFCDEMPADQAIYEYVPQPPPQPYECILTKHEWRHRFNQSARTPGLQNAIQRMPKRNCPFQISADASREYVWGLRAQLQVSVKKVLMWMTLIIFMVTLAGWVFMTQWLIHHSGDLQNAVAPVTLIMMTLGLLCLPLSWVFKADM